MRIKKRDSRGRLIKTSIHRFDIYFNEDDTPEIVEYLTSLTKKNRLNREMEVMIRFHMANKGQYTFNTPPQEPMVNNSTFANEPDNDIFDDFGAPE